ncbi:MAG: PTS galactitol transporter subunit IIC [Alkalispirochaeta sp.]
MELVERVVEALLDFGAGVFLPVVVFLLAIVFGAKIGRALRSALLVGIGFVGIELVLGLLFDNLSPVVEALVQRFGFPLRIIDVGWPAAAAIAFGSDIAVLVIPLGIGLNLVLVLTGITRTMNIDIWNFWHFAFVGALVQVATGSVWMGLVSAMLYSAVVLFFADWTAPAVQSLMGMKGISLPHGFSTPFVVPAMIVNGVIDRIPGLRDIDAHPETISTRFGVIGEPAFQGFVMGGILAGIAYAGVESGSMWIGDALESAVSLAAVMVLMPRVVSVLMEGLIPLSEAARAFLQRRAGKREIHIGLDAAIAIGHPATLATSLLMIPITLGLAVVLPGNRVLPFGDLTTIPFMVALMVPVVRGNVVRATITSTIVMIPTLYVMNAIAGFFSQAARLANFRFPEGTTTITSLVDGGSWLSWLFVVAAQRFWIGHVLILTALVVAWWRFRLNRQGWYRIAGAGEG